MLQALTLSGLKCFGQSPLVIDDLRDATFIFGANGSGKTSISRALADSSRSRWDTAMWQEGRSGDVLVYNKDFANSVIESYSRLEGVFLLGGESQELHDELDEIKSPQGRQARVIRRREGCAKNLEDNKTELDAARSTFESSVWNKKSEMPTALEPAFRGYNGAKDKFARQLLTEDSTAGGQTDDEATLIREASSIFDSSTGIENLLPLIQTLDATQIRGCAMLGTRIVGRVDARLSDLVDVLKNHDWVNQGRQYLGHSKGLCPFCQQEVPDDLAAALEELFDRTYEEQKQQLTDFICEFKSTAVDIVSAAKSMIARTNKFIDGDKLFAAVAELKRAELAAKTKLDDKFNSPANEFEPPDLSAQIDSVNELIRAANADIKDHNDRVQQRSQNHPLLVKRCWQYFAKIHASPEIAVYTSTEARLRPKIEGLNKSLEAADEELAQISLRIQSLEARMVSSAEVITRINRLLVNTGFSSFKLAPSSEVKDGYTMIREGGVVEQGTLSEGESTFITFLYFYYLVENTRVHDATRPLIVVIDDPISSMDSDAMLVVSVLVKTLVERTKNSRSRISQVIVLTHNVHFHKEVAYRRDFNADGKRIFYIIRKFADAPHGLTKHEKNPIQSAYGRLWQEVREASENPDLHSPVGLENIMRRILETYFNVLGDVGQDGVTSKFSGDDMLICRSLYLWANGGSHSLFDDNDFSPTAYSANMYLCVFREIFEKTSQSQHYRMMMHLPEPDDVKAL